MDESPVYRVRKTTVSLFIDRTTQRWVARDADGNFWYLSPGADAWHQREPFAPTGDEILEPIPGHYRELLGLPI